MRTAKIYLKQPSPIQLTDIISPLLKDPRIDQVMWRAGDNGKDNRGYYVTTADRGTLHFWPGSDGDATREDEYGNQWSWTGDLNVVDGQVSENVLTFPDYPNAFERIAGGLDCQGSGQLWLTARPGYEFGLAETTIHNGGGSHGSLHTLDSLVPLIIAGAPEGIHLPAKIRTVDVSPLCMAVLGLQQ